MLSKSDRMTELLEKTIEWNSVARAGVHDFSPTTIDLQHALLLEEIMELKEAIEAQDIVEALDAFCDIMFVGCYAAYLQDITSVSNIRVDSSLFNIVATAPTLLQNLFYNLDQRNYVQICNYMLTIAVLMDDDVTANNNTFERAYNEVLHSNYSKFPLQSEVSIANELELFKTNKKYKDVVAITVKDRVLFRADNGKGKIVKPSTFKEPQLKQFIGECNE
jgi:hypothetical protein